MISKQEVQNVIESTFPYSSSYRLGRVLNIYAYGSVVYGTYDYRKSDRDYIIVHSGNIPKEEFTLPFKTVNITSYSVEEFQKQINNHEISVLECLWLPDYLKYEEIKFEFDLNKAKLRESISAKCSNSWVKGKKKLTLQESYNPYVGKKSVWHSLRISEFGRQIATTGKIYDYQAANSFLPEILDLLTWEEINTKYKQVYNNSTTEFRKVATKQI